MVIATHDGVFHADDVFAVAMIQQLHPEATVIRTRDPDLLRGADIRIDVGLKHNPPTDFDHHQGDAPTRHGTGTPYAAAGLVALYHHERLFGDIYKEIDKSLIMNIDALDSGIQVHKNLYPYRAYDIHNVIASYMPTSYETKGLSREAIIRVYYVAFIEAVKFADYILGREIVRIKNKDADWDIVMNAIDASYRNDPRLIILKNALTWTHAVKVHAPDAEFVVSYDNLSDSWFIQTIPDHTEDQFASRKLLPASWAGKQDEELVAATGIVDAIFCHKARFIARAKTKEGILAMADHALHN
jgi:uncharacterized UPF0160 family protein